MPRTNLLWAAAGALAGAAAAALFPIALAQPTDPRRPPESPYTPREARELQMSPGTYWSLVFTNGESGGGAATFTVTTPTGALVVAARPGESVVFPCGPGWTLGVPGSIKIDGGGARSVASGLTPSGPVVFKPKE